MTVTPRAPGGDNVPLGVPITSQDAPTVSLALSAPHASIAPDAATAPMPSLSAVPEGRAKWILAAALLAVFVGSLDLTVIATLLPRMVLDLKIPTADLDRYVWVVSGYLLAYMVTIPVLGRVSDIIGRRPVFAGALVVFVIGSVITARADGLTMLITGRVVQGLGGGALVPVTMALVGDLFPARRRATIIGLVGAIDTLGWVLGPLYGAALLGLTKSWQAAFWVNVPLALITAAVLLFTWRGIRQPRVRESVDLFGALLLTLALTGLNLALSSGQEAGTGGGQLGGTANPLAAYRWQLLAGAAVAFVLFLLREWRARSPLVPLPLFRIPAFAAAAAANLLVGAALIVVMVDVPLFASLIIDDTNRASIVGAVLLTPFTLLMAGGSVLGGILTGRIGGRFTALIGVLIAAAGLFAMHSWEDAVYAVPMGGTLLVAGLGFGIVIAPVASVAIHAVRQAYYGIASGLVVVTRLMGMTVGISVLSSWGVSRLATLLSADTPAQFPGEADLAYQTRVFDYIGAQTAHFSLVTLRETFVVASVLCLVTAIPALILGVRSRHSPQHPLHHEGVGSVNGVQSSGTMEMSGQ